VANAKVLLVEMEGVEPSCRHRFKKSVYYHSLVFIIVTQP